MIQSTELKVLPDDIIPTNYTRMKGSLIRLGPSRLINPKLQRKPNHHVHTSLELSTPARSPPHDSPYTTYIKEQQTNQQPDHNFSKTMSLMVNKQLRSQKTRQRACTPTAARKMTRTPHIIEYQSTQIQAHISQQSNRYAIAENENDHDLKMSLTCFQQSQRRKKIIKKAAKTQGQVLGLKLEGTQCKIQTGSARNKKDTVKSIGKQHFESQDWYITQQGSKLNLQTRAHNQSFQRIISKIQQQKEKINPLSSQLLQSRQENDKKSRIKAPSLSRAHHQRKNSARIRQHAHLNVINFQERADLGQQPKQKQTYHDIYYRYLKLQSENQQNASSQHSNLQPKAVLQSKQIKKLSKEVNEEFNRFEREIQEIRRIPESLLDEKKKRSLSQQKNYVQSDQQRKLVERRNLMKNYTFKKSGSKLEKVIETPLQGHNQDFHVEGWNHSQQFERKEIIMMV